MHLYDGALRMCKYLDTRHQWSCMISSKKSIQYPLILTHCPTAIRTHSARRSICDLINKFHQSFTVKPKVSPRSWAPPDAIRAPALKFKNQGRNGVLDLPKNHKTLWHSRIISIHGRHWFGPTPQLHQQIYRRQPWSVDHRQGPGFPKSRKNLRAKPWRQKRGQAKESRPLV